MSTPPPTRDSAPEAVFRDPPASLGTLALVALLLPLAFLAQRWIYAVLGLPRIPIREFIYLLLLAFGISCGALFPSPVWIRADRSGVTVRNWLRLEHYEWRSIAAIEVGNPDYPRHCYLLLASASPAEQRTVLLPRLRSLSAQALTENLCASRRLYSNAGHAPGASSASPKADPGSPPAGRTSGR